jgi:hypothetical protein
MKIGRKVWLDNDTVLKPKDGKVIGWINWPGEQP